MSATPEASPAALAWPPSAVEMELRMPIEFADAQISTLSLREPTCGEWEEILAAPDHQQRRKAVSLVAGIPMKAIAMMGIGDVVRAEEYISAFFEIGQKIGV